MGRLRAGITGGAIGLLPIMLLIGTWQGAVSLGLATPALLPSPLAVFGRLAQQLQTAGYWEHVGITLFRLFSGFMIAAALGIGLGVLATTSRAFGAVLRPLVQLLAPVPKVALYPAFILLLGFDHSAKIALVVADALFPILLATAQGTARVEPKLLWSARAAGAGRLATVLTVLIPAALPAILTGCRIGLVIACIVVFLAEMITSTDGLGNLLVRASRSFRTVDMFVPLITISLLGLALNAGLNAVRARLLRGFPEEA